MTRKKLFGKRIVALMTTFAILVSLVAMLSGIAVNATSDYTPKRVLSMTNTTKTDGRIALCSAADAIGAGTVVTIKGYYKVDGFTAAGDVCYGYGNMGAAT